jgi:hypothetical protein
MGAAAVTEQTPEAYEEEAKLVFKISLTANQSIPDLSQWIDKDSDFVWMETSASSTGAFSWNPSSPGGKQMYSAEARNVNCLGTGQFPVPLARPLTYIAGSKIPFSMTDQSGNPNTIELVFHGIRRYPVQSAA